MEIKYDYMEKFPLSYRPLHHNHCEKNIFNLHITEQFLEYSGHGKGTYIDILRDMNIEETWLIIIVTSRKRKYAGRPSQGGEFEFIK